MRTLESGGTWTTTLQAARSSEAPSETEIHLSLVRDDRGERIGAVAIGHDVSQERALEAQLRQAQKMEAVGQLAGGIAHDFNNLLTAIHGYAELALDQLQVGDPGHDEIEQVILAADRATAITRQLLAFSRRQVMQPRVLDVDEAVESLAPMLRVLLGEHIELATFTHSGGRVKVDPGQLEQVLVNLAVNASDAMPGGGRLTIGTNVIDLGSDYAATHPEAPPGSYVQLEVSDTGHGMDEETRVRAFDPFFTTKAMGKGTGMGLATVYGIVRQSGGFIYLYSELGSGTTFRVYIPRVEESATADGVAGIGPAPSGSETILLVEDDPLVRAFAVRALSAQGYAVVEASGGADAVAYAEQDESPIDLLVTDLIMPMMNGRQLAETIGRLRPGLRVLYVSGFPESHLGGISLSEPDVAFLPKPYTASQLGRAVRELIDTPF